MINHNTIEETLENRIQLGEDVLNNRAFSSNISNDIILRNQLVILETLLKITTKLNII